MLRILMLHNRYLQVGGEDVSARSEISVLRSRGHEVDFWEVSNQSLQSESRVATAASAIWSRSATAALANRLQTARYDIVHVHNYFARLSPAVHWIAARHRVASIQHLNNYRLTCANAQLFREGAECLKCVGSRVAWQGIRYGCYRDSRAASAAVAATMTAHRLLGTWRHRVTRYIAVSDYVRDIHVRAGLPQKKISVRTNIIVPPEPDAGVSRKGVFLASRLSPEKGVEVLIRAWRKRQRSEILEIAGTGQCEAALRALAAGDPTIRFLGHIEHDEVLARMAAAKAVVVCALWAEPFGRTATEAMAVGTPVIASATGGLKEILTDVPECLVPPGDAEALDAALTKVISEPAAWARHSEAVRTSFACRFSPDALAAATETIYEAAIAERYCREA